MSKVALYSVSVANHRIKSSVNFTSVTTEMIYFDLEVFPSSFNSSELYPYITNVSATMEQN